MPETDDPDAPGFRAPHARSRRKDTRRWCRGKEGVEHRVEVRLFRDVSCRAWDTPSAGWVCFHERVCVECGRRLGLLRPEECPTRPEGSR